jgi:hypothetical protein
MLPALLVDKRDPILCYLFLIFYAISRSDLGKKNKLILGELNKKGAKGKGKKDKGIEGSVGKLWKG